ncbi:MAG: DUF2330 domain-containing protein [Alphaproteobacteria bacterium]|nr:DUF2330 domain-containing protein [Alphaproteobacteria bacterium]
MLAALVLSSLSPAHACGGFFCNNSAPVVQKAERIVFAVDEDAGFVETHVQVEYEGPSEEFAWIVPVQAAPELFLSTDVLFDTVGFQLQPVHQMVRVDEGRCREPISISFPCLGCSYDTFLDAENGAFRGVDVIATDVVGPYETATIQADSIEALMAWLDLNEFDVPSEAAGSIAPYVSANGYFVALKLRKGADTGDLKPLGMRYAGDRPAIPIQLTAVAAAPDLRLEVTIFGARRAVPESYLHVELNEAAIDWFTGGSNYLDVITRAADEAGGHAFATDYAGPTEDALFPAFAVDVDVADLSAAPTPTDWVNAVQASGFSGTQDVLEALRLAAPVAPGFDEISVYNCPSCQDGWYAGEAWDAAAATQLLVQLVVEPREQVDAMIRRYPYVTRLTSSISASEMTVDPTFVFNDGMADVPLVRSASLVFECNGKYRRKADRRLELPNGLAVALPSQRWFEKHGMTESEYLADLGELGAVRIEQTGSGAPEVLVDLTGVVADQVDGFNGLMGGSGCGCSGTGPGASGALALLGLLGLRRRRA